MDDFTIVAVTVVGVVAVTVVGIVAVTITLGTEGRRNYVFQSTSFIVTGSPFESNSAVVIIAVVKADVTGVVVMGDSVTAAIQ